MNACFLKSISFSKWRKSALLLALLVNVPLTGIAQHHTGVTVSDKPSTHGMLLFGGTADANIYASHLPMFHSPHDYQVLLRLALPESVHALYKASRQQFPNERVYTIEPEVFVLPEMMRHPRPFKVQLYRGHFERGGTKIAENVVVEIRTILHVRKFDPQQKRAATSEYFVFGTAKEAFVAHTISAKPDFDQICSVQNSSALAQLLAKNLFAALMLPKRANTPLADNDSVLAQAKKGTLPVRIAQSLYCEFDDLKE
ncbi:MAG: hypothetical protein EAZ92_05325 [Candidatus Kapaibacterium sp.]|nr:MAG: hypothetical protein EAZ92_05325 [Candidatus Kapabacteria bacterium]